MLCLTPNLKMSLLNKVWRISKVFELTCKIWNDPFHFCVSDGTFSLFHHVVDEKDSPGWQLLTCESVGSLLSYRSVLVERCLMRGTVTGYFLQDTWSLPKAVTLLRPLFDRYDSWLDWTAPHWFLSLFNIMSDPIYSIKFEARWNIKRCKQHFSCQKRYKAVRAR